MYSKKELSFYNASFTYESHDGLLQVQLDINSEDKILNVGFNNTIEQSVKNICQQLEELENKIIGKYIHDLSFLNLGLLSIPALTVWLAIQDYTNGLNQTFEAYGANPDQLICRCKGIDKATLQASIDRHEADKKKVVNELQISQICGGCKSQFENILAQSTWRQDYFADIPNSRWIENIQVALSRSSLGQSKPLPLMSYEVIRYQSNKVKLRATGDRNGLNRFELTQILQEFLQEKIHPQISVSVVL